MKKIFVLISTVLLFTACKKYKELANTDDLNGKAYYSGQLQYVNNLDSPGIPHALASVHVQLYKKTEPVNYLFDSTTDNLGYFVFRNLKDGDYRLRVNKIIGNAIYDTTREFSIHNGQDYADSAWTLKPSELRQNGIVFTIRDAFQGYLNGTKIFLYSSSVLAAADINNDGTGSSVQFPLTNGYGKTVMLNIPALPFYVIKMKTSNNLVKTDILSTGLSQNGILRLERVIP